MTDAILIAVLGAVFNAGVIWGTITALNARMLRMEQSLDVAHKRIDYIGIRKRRGVAE